MVNFDYSSRICSEVTREGSVCAKSTDLLDTIRGFIRLVIERSTAYPTDPRVTIWF